ncbi:MAG TPA: TetR family transcriptional regulator [Solirubrobacteraceae bacterium]|nr:TetR family transcriptional regulator [Solirubrobacteraceae bacterium]
MQAALAQQPEGPDELAGDKAARIVEAMRASVAARGIAGSTFDHVAREAGVSRGLLHYYFGTKERLLLEVVRREAEVREQRLEDAMADARSAEELLRALVRSFEEILGEGPTGPVMFFEMLTLAQRHEEVAAELAALGRRTREAFAAALRTKSEAGVLQLRDEPTEVAAFLFALADGIVIRRLSEPSLDIAPLMKHGVAAARALLS